MNDLLIFGETINVGELKRVENNREEITMINLTS